MTSRRPDQRVASVIFNSPTTHGRREMAKAPIQCKSHFTPTGGKIELDSEIVPDSEDERRWNGRGKELVEPDVIEISSDEEVNVNFGGSEEPSTEDPFLSKVPGAWPDGDTVPLKVGNVDKLLGQDWAPRAHTTPKLRRTYRSRMIVQSSSSEGSDHDLELQHATDIIELSDSSPDQSPKRGPKVSAALTARALCSDDSRSDDGAILILNEPISAPKIPAALTAQGLCSDDSCSDDDGAILILNEPKSARKPIRVNPSNARSITAIADPKLITTPTRPKSLKGFPGTPYTPRSESSPARPKQVPRTSKKARAASEQARRAAYAQQLFTELNRVIFGDGLPQDTRLNWNKRLLTTAGRAKWHRSRDGVQTTEIELAEKILDCEERIRNTLSHEMCHLATWIINANTKEAHGNLWKGWAAKVMRKRPEITITTRHNYEISHPFEWECQKCAKIYGRFSKSIRPDECVCGACKEGKLVPLFSDVKKISKKPKTSQNASTKPKDSPCSLPRPQTVNRHSGQIDDSCPVLCGPEHYPVHTIHDSDSESDSNIKVLTKAMRSIGFDT